MDKYIFTSDYTGKVNTMQGGRPVQIPVQFKKGQIVDGKTYTRGINGGINQAFSATETVVDINTQYGVCTIPISNSMATLISPIAKVGKVTSTEQPHEMPNETVQDKNRHIDSIEDKIYSKIGIKYSDGAGFGILGFAKSSRFKGRMIVLLLAVGGYLTYKKYSK